MVNNKGPALEKPATLSVPCPPQEVVMEAPKLTAGSDSDPRDSDSDLIGETPEKSVQIATDQNQWFLEKEDFMLSAFTMTYVTLSTVV